jgi:diacylglycerol kinase (ATP)
MTDAARSQSPGQEEDPRRVRRIRVIWNPNAGSKAGLPTNRAGEEQLRDLMARYGLGDELIVSGSEADAIAASRDAVANGYDVVVAAGGDGTVGTVAFQLIRAETALGVLPLGSAMNVARSLGIPRELEAAAAILADGNVRAIDVGMANRQLFLEVGSVGLNAAIFGEAHRFDKGEYSSFFGLLATLIRFQPARMRVALEGRSISTRALMIAVANAPYTGVGFTFAPDARLDDGLLDVRIYDHFSKWELIRHLASIAAGRRAYSPKVRTYRSRSVRVEARHPRPVRVDARNLGTTPVEFSLMPGVLKVVAPPTGIAPENDPNDRASADRTLGTSAEPRP